MINPLLQEWKTPFGNTSFPDIKTSHFKPAVEEAIKSATEEISGLLKILICLILKIQLQHLSRPEKLWEELLQFSLT